MVDHGASVTDTQLQIARDSALVILNAIDEHDKVGDRGQTSPLLPRLGKSDSVALAVLLTPPRFSSSDLDFVGGRGGSLLLPGPVL